MSHIYIAGTEHNHIHSQLLQVGSLGRKGHGFPTMTGQFFTERNNLGMLIATKWRHNQFFQFPVHLVRCGSLGNLQLNILLQLM